jgi:IS30 family transposase
MNLAGWSTAKIGRAVGRHRSTIGRELKRNTNHWGQYLDEHADRRAKQRRRAAARRDCSGDAALMDHVERKIRSRWSPEQIAARLKIAPPAGLVGKSISHATICRWI